MKTKAILTVVASLLIVTALTSQVGSSPQYQVVEADATEPLEESVTALMKRGWKPQGGVSVVFQSINTSPRIRYYQSMVK